MKAGQWDGKLKKVVVNDVPVPDPVENQFLVKIHSASLCHSDLMMDFRPEIPVTLGHEGVGYIEKIHPTAEGKGFKVGDAIGFNYFIGCCFECEACMVHNMHCETGNSKLQGFAVDGYFAEYAVVDYHNAVHLPKNLEMKRCAPIFCAGITAFHAVDSCELQAGQWLAVVGCGGLGQFATKYAKAMGVKVVGLDINDETLEVCKQAGADAVFNTMKNKNYLEEIKKLTGKGCHAAAVFSAAQAAYTNAPPLLRIGGTLMVIGIAPKPLEVSTMDLVLGKYKIKADSTSIPQRMQKAVDFTGKHNILPEVEYRKIDDLPQMVEDMHNGKAKFRQVVVF
ncbi:GroES-like protein [Patellaria atrata CBS 101060]|uniref:GroES-like protein n=1 Tax=Patellaria atrata CBS 101060 TaxID=1346257 RepID=A0A9P4VSY3_9PEZI|nr:GroES-like protein [Patellaria atrata CBS 101060]